MVARFSVGAMISLAVAGLAGLVMAWFIESDIGSYWSTDWGRLMLLKLLLVLIALALGAYNHFRMLPGARRRSGRPRGGRRAPAPTSPPRRWC